jgi:hypothetical protein
MATIIDRFGRALDWFESTALSAENEPSSSHNASG